ncbi:MAG: pyridoxamine 5'-phosphate oxidase family protein [Deltaproteobacteria bacterium]|nr:pyridoxamine 5'-phosphate oxidase family protein [Deltaproteobacteria bacterium]
MSRDMLERISAFVKSKDSCVLATSTGDKPHCSLMVYVADDQCREIYMVTQQTGTKYANLKQNPNVSLLIDTREEHQGKERPNALALTVNGRFEEIQDLARKAEITGVLLERHPHMADFVSDARITVFAVKVTSFLLMDGLTESHYMDVNAS